MLYLIYYYVSQKENYLKIGNVLLALSMEPKTCKFFNKLELDKMNLYL